jgi:hypothetical protein
MKQGQNGVIFLVKTRGCCVTVDVSHPRVRFSSLEHVGAWFHTGDLVAPIRQYPGMSPSARTKLEKAASWSAPMALQGCGNPLRFRESVLLAIEQVIHRGRFMEYLG